MQALIAVLAGDGIGGEVPAGAVRALSKVGARFNHQFEFQPALIGGAAIDATGVPLPPATLDLAQRADAILLGAVGGPKWSDPNAKVRPEQGLLQLREALGLFANLRPVVPHPAVLDASPIKAERLRGVDIMVVRELTGGKSGGWCPWPPVGRVPGERSCPPWTRRTCSRLPACGAPPSI